MAPCLALFVPVLMVDESVATLTPYLDAISSTCILLAMRWIDRNYSFVSVSWSESICANWWILVVDLSFSSFYFSVCATVEVCDEVEVEGGRIANRTQSNGHLIQNIQP